ncbi:MAG: hypothetical protein AAFV98_21000, partial [Chloroflexota bacterium]
MVKRILYNGLPPINYVVWSPTGDRFAAGCQNGGVMNCNQNFELLHTLKGFIEQARDISWHPDGHLLVTAENMDTHEAYESSYEAFQRMRIWDAHTGEPLHTLYETDVNAPMRVRWHPNGKRLVASFYNNEIWIWDVVDGDYQHTGTLTGHTEYAPSLAWGHDDNTLISSAYDNTYRIWNCETFTEERVIPHDSTNHYLTYHRQTDHLVVKDSPRNVAIWHVSSNEKICTLQKVHKDGGYNFHFSADGARIMGKLDKFRIGIWDSQSGKLLQSYLLPDKFVRSMRWVQEGRGIIASLHSTLIYIDTQTSEKPRTLLDDNHAYIALAWHDGLLVGIDDKTSYLQAWQADKDMGLTPLLEQLPDLEGLYSAKLNQDTQQVVLGYERGDIAIWDLKRNQMDVLDVQFSDSINVIKHVAWLSDTLIVASTYEESISIIDIEESEILHRFRRSDVGYDNFEQLITTPDKQRILCSTYRMAYALSTDDLHEISKHNVGYYVVCNPTGTQLVKIARSSSQTTFRLVIVDVLTNNELSSFGVLYGQRDIQTIVWHPASTHIAIGTYKGWVHLVSLDDDNAIQSVKEHDYLIDIIVFSSDGMLFATGGNDHKVIIWDTATMTPLHTIYSTGWITALDFSEDGDR